MGKENYRFRDKQLSIRITEYEYQLIQKRKECSGASSLREYIVDAATNGYLIKVDYSDIKRLAYEINRIGNNINQIAHKINSENLVYKAEIEEIQEDINMIWKMIRAKFYQIP
ncbi:MAG: MobC family plasmid mobilization relaxosome protein [Ruminococcus flavefaciens]|nr:MobC family plasmid mobilization relaxosome protein [Ruminococcus flavefaciens]